MCHLRKFHVPQINFLWPNSPGPPTDNWKVTDNSSVNFHDVFFFLFCYNLAKNEEKHIMEIYVSGAGEIGPNISDGKFENVSLIFVSVSDPLSEEA
jgi:hypothetical protein